MGHTSKLYYNQGFNFLLILRQEDQQDSYLQEILDIESHLEIFIRSPYASLTLELMVEEVCERSYFCGCYPPWRAQHCTGNSRELHISDRGWVGCRSSQIFCFSTAWKQLWNEKQKLWLATPREDGSTHTNHGKLQQSLLLLPAPVQCRDVLSCLPQCRNVLSCLPWWLQLCHCHSAAVVHAIGIHLPYPRNWNPSKRSHWPFN